MSYINLNRIEFIITYQCTGKCKHCSVGSRLHQTSNGRHVLADKAVEAIEKLSAMYDIKSVMTFGGEPLLYPDVVCAIHKKAAECDIEIRSLITNGYFTANDDKCREVAYNLAQSEVNHVLISVDAFHQETISQSSVYTFAKYVIESGIANAKLHPAWVVNNEHENQYNVKTKEILSSFLDLGTQISSGNNIFLSGNARDHLSQYYDKPQLDLSIECGTLPYTSPLTDVSSISIAPNGDVEICSFVIGNIYDEDIIDIVTRYNPYSDKYMKTIIDCGVSSLLSYAETIGIKIDTSQYYSVCDVCNSIMQQIYKQEKMQI